MEFFTFLHQFNDAGLLTLRLATGVIFLAHGMAKMSMWKMSPSEQMPKGTLNLMRFLSIVEPLGAIALIFGFLTQPATLGLGIIMLGAIYKKVREWHAPFLGMKALGWEFDLILLAVNFALYFSGAGAFALDRIFFGL